MDLSFPSEHFPGPPAFRLRFPDGWAPKPLGAATLGAVDLNSAEGFTNNVVVIVSRVIGDHPLEELVARMWARTSAEQPGAEQRDVSAVTLADHAGQTCTVILPAGVQPISVAQVQAVVLVPTANADQRDLIQMHGSCALENLDTYRPVFDQIFSTLDVAIS